MSQPNKYVITAKDFSRIEDFLDTIEEDDQVFAPLIRRRLAESEIVFGDDIEADRVTLDSRIVFRVNDSPAYTRTLVLRSQGCSRKATLPVASFRGIALLGLKMGGTSFAEPSVGQRETLFVDAVLFQPEASARHVDNGQVATASL